MKQSPPFIPPALHGIFVPAQAPFIGLSVGTLGRLSGGLAPVKKSVALSV